MIAIVDTGGANLSSVINALNRLHTKSLVTCQPDQIFKASKILFPGVGAAKASMDRIQKAELKHVMQELKQPVLGICLGMQLLFEGSTEGDTSCLGIIPGLVHQIPKHRDLSLPHMGWNRLRHDHDSLLLQHIDPGAYFYFVHSFQAPDSDYTVAHVNYGVKIPAIVEKDNYFGVQFHPEKSAKNGQLILRNFLEL